MIVDIKEKLRLLTPGHHGCFFYNHPQAAIETTLTFIKIGLERKEQSIYLADPVTIEKTKSACAQFGIDILKETERGSVILTSGRGYLLNGCFEAGRMIDFIDESYQAALKAGFAGLRGTGDIVWELGADLDMSKIAGYEQKLDRYVQNKKFTVLCQYNMQVLSGQYLRESLLTHNAVIRDNNVCLENHFHNCGYDFRMTSFEAMCNSLSK